MEKAILKTLIYADLFEYPLTIFEIHKWLIGKKCNLRQVEKALKRLKDQKKVLNIKDYWVLIDKRSLVKKRLERQKQSLIYFRKVILISQLFKVIPWIKLVGISGGLSMENAGKLDDIDLILITSKNRIWISRLLVLGILSLLGQRREVSDNPKSAAGKICCNLILEQDQLEQTKKNIYIAHEVLQMKVLWQREGIYNKFLESNEWVFKYLPNWVGGDSSRQPRSLVREHRLVTDLFNFLENMAKNIQIKIMDKPKGIEEGKLFFYPGDYQQKILINFKHLTHLHLFPKTN